MTGALSALIKFQRDASRPLRKTVLDLKISKSPFKYLHLKGTKKKKNKVSTVMQLKTLQFWGSCMDHGGTPMAIRLGVCVSALRDVHTTKSPAVEYLRM